MASRVDWGAELERHQRWLRTVLLARTGDHAVAEDLWQQVALAAVGQADGRGVDRVAPWLYRIALRQVLLHRRRMGRERRREKIYAEARPAFENEPDPLDWLLADEERSLVSAAVRRLEPQEAEILMLKYTEDWSYRQIASHLGMSESAVESRLVRARSKLRRELAALAEPSTLPVVS